MKKAIITLLALSIAILPFSHATAKKVDKAETEATEQTNKIGSVFGKVTEVRDYYDQNGQVVNDKKFIAVIDENNSTTVFVVTKESYSISNTPIDNIKVGDKFNGFYDATLPVIMIYPTQYTAVAFTVNFPDTKNIKVDVFNDDLTSSDNQLKLNVSDKTEVELKNGEVYTGGLKGKTLAVIYTFTTRSIPAQTTPEKIIVLDDSTEQEEVVNPISFITGKVTKVSKIYEDKKAVKDKRIIYIKGSNNLEASFVISSKTLFITESNVNSIKVGDTFTGYYDNTKPMILIYPAQYDAIAVASSVKKAMIKVDVFNDELISSDGSLKINIAKFTKIVDQNGKKYNGEIKNKNIVVLYKYSTDSIPEQTNPFKIIVLDDLK